MSKQIKTTIEIDYKERNRKTVFWRGILLFPAGIFLASFSQWGGWDYISGAIVLPTILALTFRGRYPSYILHFNHALLELSTRFSAYALLLTDDYPSIERNAKVEITFPEIEDGKSLNRYLPLVKWFLAIPHFLLLCIYSIIAVGMTIVAWVMTISTGKYPKWAGKFVYRTIKYMNRVIGYAFVLVSDKYPSFRL